MAKLPNPAPCRRHENLKGRSPKPPNVKEAAPPTRTSAEDIASADFPGSPEA